jgi:glycosyltransferase involved in cell wall biosynthesis
MRLTRLCFVIDKLALRSGGAERVLIETVNALYDRGYCVEIVTHEVRGKRPFYPVRKGVILSNVRPRNEHRSRLRCKVDGLRAHFHQNRVFLPILDQLQWMSQHGAFHRRLAVHIDATRPDVVIGFLPPAVTAVGLAQTQHKPRLFASLHNVPEQDFDNPERWDANPVDRRIRKQVLNQFDGIGTLLPEFIEWFPRSLRDRLFVMPNAAQPVDDDVIKRASRKKIVASVGRLADVKQHDVLIDAWKLLQDDFPDWACEIFGKGPNETHLQDKIKSLGLQRAVLLRGDTKNMEKVYTEASILAHPAQFEGFGLVVSEALSYGIPVVGFEDCSGFNFIVDHNCSGIHTSASGDRAFHLSRALAKLMTQPDQRERMGAAGRERVKAFSPEKVIDLWEMALRGEQEDYIHANLRA